MIVAEVIVLPVPGGPWINVKSFCKAAWTANTCELFNSVKPGIEYDFIGYVGKKTGLVGFPIIWSYNDFDIQLASKRACTAEVILSNVVGIQEKVT